MPFGSGSLTWESAEVEPWPPDAPPMREVLDWLREVHAGLMKHVQELSDAELSRPRMANWGEEKETRWLLSTRMRSLHAGEDRWQWQIALGIER